MKLTLEQFDFSALTKDSILMVEVANQSSDDFTRTQRTIKAMIDSGKIPKGVLVLINSKHSPMNLKEIPEKVMNQNGWIKLRIQTENTPEKLTEIKSMALLDTVIKDSEIQISNSHILKDAKKIVEKAKKRGWVRAIP